MSKGQVMFSAGLMLASFLLFLLSIAYVARRAMKNKKDPEKYNKAGMNTALIFSVVLLFLIWFLRFAVGNVSIVPEADSVQLTPIEEGINSLFGALRTFAMEEEYGEYIVKIKSLISEIVPKDHRCFSAVQTLAVVYASLLNFIAPLLGGAIILEILASIFPAIKLMCSYAFVKRPKYFFSELNPASLSLAKSIYYKEKDEKPVLIFTDTYVDDEKEKEYELLLEAKRYGAICVRDDLAHVQKAKRGKRTYFLMDENEFGNLQTLLGLTEERNLNFIKGAQVYLFVQSDAYVQVERQVEKEFRTRIETKQIKESEKPTIVPVNGYRNLVQNLFVEIPLYEPLIHKDDKTKLKITIFGNGTIGTEAFLNAYWFGQMMISDENEETMSECELTINVVSKDSEEVFWSKMDYINPEIKETVKTDKSGDVNKLLFYDVEGTKANNPYCCVHYKKADVKFGGFLDGKEEEIKPLLDSDYFIVALGNDADNVSVGDKLRRLVGKKHLEEKDTDRQVVIAYAVFDSDLAKTLNSEKQHQYRVKEECVAKEQYDIYMHAFGSLEDVYSYDNIYMSKNKLLAEGVGAAYDKVGMRQKHVEDHKERSLNENKNYSYWSDLARAMHIKYKAFSSGLIDQSIFDASPRDHKDYINEQCHLYKKLVSYNADWRFEELSEKVHAFEKKKNALAWLEHRRWVAFARAQGYQYTGELEKNLRLNGENHKNMELKLHPCLVEAAKPSKENPYYLKDALKTFFEEPDDKFDTDSSDKNQMIDLINKKKEHLTELQKRLCESDKIDGIDALDKTTFEWCKIATKVSLEKIEQVLKDLQGDKKLTEAFCKEIKKVWGGIYCCDFKMYDYPQCDYDDYLTDKELAKLLGVEQDHIAKLCRNKKFVDAESIQKSKEPEEWHIPFRSAKDEIKELYRELDVKDEKDPGKKDQARKDGKGMIELFGKWYQKK